MKYKSIRVLTYFLVVIVSISCYKQNQSKFSLEGITESLEDGVVLYLFDSANKKIIDSARVQNNTFSFKTNLPSAPLRISLKNDNNSLYRMLWLENKAMQFDASKHSFENAIVTGSNSETIYINLYQAVDTLSRKEQEKLLMNFIKNNNTNILSSVVLSEWYISWKKQKTEPLYNQLSEKSKNSFYGKKVLNYLELNQNPEVGEKFVDFELPNQNGDLVRLSNLDNKLILLEFWASWCVPCRKDNKELVSIHNKFKSQDFDIFQVSLDSNKEYWLNAVKQDNLSWTNASDLNGWNNKASLIYGINLLPSNFLIDEKGVIIAKDLRGQKLEQKIKSILESKG